MCPATRLRLLLDRYPTGVYRRVTGTSASTSRTRIGGLPPSAAWNASRLRRSRHREIARLCAEAAVGRGGALLASGAQGQQLIASTRCRPERDHLDQAGVLGHGNSLPPAPEGSRLHDSDFARRQFQSETPGSAGRAAP